MEVKMKKSKKRKLNKKKVFITFLLFISIIFLIYSINNKSNKRIVSETYDRNMQLFSGMQMESTTEVNDEKRSVTLVSGYIIII